MRLVMLVVLALLQGCARLWLEGEPSFPTHHAEWVRAETARLAVVEGSNPDLQTRFLNLPPQDGKGGWTTWYITICLLDDNWQPKSDRQIHNLWHHEWLHALGPEWWRFGEHEEEFRAELRRRGLYEE